MAGEPILVASNCAVISVVEPLVSGTAPSETSVDFGMMTLLAQAIDAPILQLIGDADFVVDEDLFVRSGEVKRRHCSSAAGDWKRCLNRAQQAGAHQFFQSF